MAADVERHPRALHQRQQSLHQQPCGSVGPHRPHRVVPHHNHPVRGAGVQRGGHPGPLRLVHRGRHPAGRHRRVQRAVRARVALAALRQPAAGPASPPPCPRVRVRVAQRGQHGRRRVHSAEQRLRVHHHELHRLSSAGQRLLEGVVGGRHVPAAARGRAAVQRNFRLDVAHPVVVPPHQVPGNLQPRRRVHVLKGGGHARDRHRVGQRGGYAVLRPRVSATLPQAPHARARAM